MDCSCLAGESRSGLSTFHWEPTNKHWLSESSFWWIPETAWVGYWVVGSLRELSASIVYSLRVETRVNANVHIMHVVLQLNPSKSGKIVSMTGSDKTRVTFAPLSADPPNERSSGLNVGGEIASCFWQTGVGNNLDSLLLTLLVFPRFSQHTIDKPLQTHNGRFGFQE
jgi:hypothetical protein